MLTENDPGAAGQATAAPASGRELTNNAARIGIASVVQNRLGRMLRVEWLGQTVASLAWIASVLAYGISATGDWLQLLAASAWLLANISSLVADEAD